MEQLAYIVWPYFECNGASGALALVMSALLQSIVEVWKEYDKENKITTNAGEQSMQIHPR